VVFADRFDDARYVNDVSYLIRLQPNSLDEKGLKQEVCVPERLMHRLVYLAIAYELPLLSRLPVAEDYEEWTYPEVQAVSLERELAFLLQRVSDPLLTTVLRPFTTLVTAAIRHPHGRSIVVETPY